MTIDEALNLEIAASKDGRAVKAKYLHHPYFDKNSNLCLTLHYIFVRYTSTVAYTHGYSTNRAFTLFFDYLTEHKASTPPELHPKQFTDISVEIQLGFQDFLLRSGETPMYAEALKKCANVVARNYGTIPVVMIAAVNRRKVKPTEPLGDDAYESLKAALIAHIDKLYEKLEWRVTVESSTPYAYETIPPNDQLNPILLRKWQPDHARTMKTLLDHDFPMQLTLEEIYEFTGRGNISSQYRDCTTILKVIGYLYIQVPTSDKKINLDQLLEQYFPTSMDQCAIALFLMLQSGWNKETVLALDGDDFEHVLTGSIDEDLTIIFSEKSRSQGIGLPYEAPKLITASSNKTDKYSIYNLISLARKLSAPLQGYAFDSAPIQAVGRERNELFLFLRAPGDWFKNGSRHSSIDITNSWTRGIKRFLREYEIYESGQRLKTVNDVAKRLRPTWLMHKKHTMPMSMISAHFGHSDESTTDIYYDSSGAAMKERKGRLRRELDEVVQLLITGKFRGLLGRKANDQASAAVTLFTIPGHERSMWGCENQYSPDWSGHDKELAPGQRCFRLEKCLGCSRVRLFEDSLPYLLERLSHIEHELESEQISSRNSNLEWEKQILEYVIQDCHDEDAINGAALYRRKHWPLLPRDLSSLRVIFDEELADV